MYRPADYSVHVVWCNKIVNFLYGWFLAGFRSSYACAHFATLLSLPTRGRERIKMWSKGLQSIARWIAMMLAMPVQSRVQGTTKRLRPDLVNKRRNNCVPLPAAGRRTQLIHLIFSEPWKHTCAGPCICNLAQLANNQARSRLAICVAIGLLIYNFHLKNMREVLCSPMMATSSWFQGSRGPHAPTLATAASDGAVPTAVGRAAAGCEKSPGKAASSSLAAAGDPSDKGWGI